MNKKNNKSVKNIKELILFDLSEDNVYIEEKHKNVDILEISLRENELNKNLINIAQNIFYHSTKPIALSYGNELENCFKSLPQNRYSDCYEIIIDILYCIFKNKSNKNELIKILKESIVFFNKTEKEIAKKYYDTILFFADKTLVSGDIETSLEYYKLLGLLTHVDSQSIEVDYLLGSKKPKDSYLLLFKYVDITMDELNILLNSYIEKEIKEVLFNINAKVKKISSFIFDKNIEFTSEVRSKIFVLCWLKAIITPAYTYVYTCGVNQLKRLSNNIKTIKDKNDLLNVTQFLNNNQDSAKLLKDSISLFYYVKEIKNLLIIKDKNKINNICYYTSLDTFYYLFLKSNKACNVFFELEEKDKKDVGYLEVMNQSYMNDPSEGEMLFSVLNIDKEPKNKRKVLNSNSVYLKSFSELIDYLPMWNLYGNRGKGVCVVINAKETFNNEDLYNICYVSQSKEIKHEDNANINDKAIQRINFLIEKIRNICKKHYKIEEFITYASREINLLSYLFKSANYSYEKETRFLCENNRTENYIDVNNNYKMLSIKSPFKLNIKELILGPCFDDVNMYIPYLDMLLKKLEQQDNIEITMSEIDFR